MALGITKVTGTPMSAVSVAAAGASPTYGTALNAIAGERFDHLVFQVSVTFDASATGAVDIHRRKSADDGTTDSILGTAILSIAAPTSATPQVQTFELVGGDYIEVGALNNDATYAATVTIIYEGTKITGLA